ncbi:MAG TPA: hypothetical protein PLW81_00560 [Thiobacillaceae bacterium]|nr:hypothetical protein [Thiobacillaceae bacterium]
MLGKFTAKTGFFWGGHVVPKGSTFISENPAEIAELVSAGRLEPADEATRRNITWTKGATWGPPPPEDPRWTNARTGLPRVPAAKREPAGFGPPPWLTG